MDINIGEFFSWGAGQHIYLSIHVSIYACVYIYVNTCIYRYVHVYIYI